VEAASIDGAGGFRIFRDITLPILKPIFVILASLSVIWNFQVFSQIWIIRNARPEDDYFLLSIYSFVESFRVSQYGLGAAIAVVMVLLMLAGINMFVFEVITVRKVSEWDTAATTPPAARIAGILSLTLWAGFVILGRWIRYTKRWNFAAPDDLDLDNLFGVVTALMPHFA
jgi:ABC-type Fe3+ transport system permease subunit